MHEGGREGYQEGGREDIRSEKRILQEGGRELGSTEEREGTRVEDKISAGWFPLWELRALPHQCIKLPSASVPLRPVKG